MQQPQNNFILHICSNLNFLTCMKVLIGGFLSITLSMSTAYADDKTKPGSYKENTKLSGLLEEEQFQMGLSCNDAMKAFKLDKKTNSIFESSHLGLGKGKTVKPGFFKGSCRGKQLKYVKKYISVNDSKLNRKVVFDTFIKQYGKPSFQREGVDNIRYFLMFKDTYTEFSLYLRQEKNKIITIYELEDTTPKVKKK